MSRLKYQSPKNTGREQLIFNLRTDPVSTTHASLNAEWLPDGYGPECFSRGSNRLVWWHCRYGHFFTKKIAQRTKALDKRSRSKGCPYCSGPAALAKNGLAMLFPDLMIEWIDELNGSAGHVSPKSMRTVLWKCAKDHIYACMIVDRISNGQRCPKCDSVAHMDTSSILERTTLLFDRGSHDYHGPAPLPNFGYDDRDLPVTHKVWWNCKVNAQHYFYRSFNQLHDVEYRCPQCERENPGVLADFSQLMKQFHRTLNRHVNPKNLSATSSDKVWWFCRRHPESAWQAPIHHRTLQGKGCPACTSETSEVANQAPAKLTRSRETTMPSVLGAPEIQQAKRMYCASNSGEKS